MKTIAQEIDDLIHVLLSRAVTVDKGQITKHYDVARVLLRGFTKKLSKATPVMIYQRQMFEEWFWNNKCMNSHPTAREQVFQRVDNGYMYSTVDGAWRAWMASAMTTYKIQEEADKKAIEEEIICG